MGTGEFNISDSYVEDAFDNVTAIGCSSTTLDDSDIRRSIEILKDCNSQYIDQHKMMGEVGMLYGIPIHEELINKSNNKGMKIIEKIRQIDPPAPY